MMNKFNFFSYLSDKCPKFALKFLHLLKEMKIKPVTVKQRVHLFHYLECIDKGVHETVGLDQSLGGKKMINFVK